MRWIPERRWARYLVLSLAALVSLVLLLAAVRAWLLRSEVALQSILADEPLEMPTHLAEFPDGSGDMAVTEKTGKIKWFHRDAARAAGVLVDLTDRVVIEGWEDGLLSLAFHPGFAENGWFFVTYNAGKPRRIVIARFRAEGPERRVNRDEERVILTVAKPGPNHNGGMLAFAQDGTLFASIGDSQVSQNGQALDTLLGKILRIDVDHPDEGQAYGIPRDNPFAAGKAKKRPEIWAYGLRNAWRFSIDPETGGMFAGDVGSERFEEIDRIEKGGNYGWAVLEGMECIIPKKKRCDRPRYLPPLAAFSRVISRSVIGGYVYRGKALPWLRGTYVFGDLFRGVYGIPADGKPVIGLPDALLYRPNALHGPNAGHEIRLSSLAEDLDRELYLVDLVGGLYRIVPR